MADLIAVVINGNIWQCHANTPLSYEGIVWMAGLEGTHHTVSFTSKYGQGSVIPGETIPVRESLDISVVDFSKAKE